MPVMRKEPIFAPHFAHKRMGIGQRSLPLRGFTDVGDDVFRFNLIGANQVGNRRICAGLIIVKQSYTFPFKETDTESIGVMVGNAAAAAETLEGKHNVRWGITVHAEQLAHNFDLYCFNRNRTVGLWYIGQSVSIDTIQYPHKINTTLHSRTSQ